MPRSELEDDELDEDEDMILVHLVLLTGAGDEELEEEDLEDLELIRPGLRVTMLTGL